MRAVFSTKDYLDSLALSFYTKGMKTIRFTVDDEVKKSFNKWAKQSRKSQSDILRDMVRVFAFTEAFKSTHERACPMLENLRIETEDQLYAYLASDETYESRLQNKTSCT